MLLNIEIDNNSGFCFGVTTAIKTAEEELDKGEQLYCLGDIVHNGTECDRLATKGLKTIGHDELKQLHDARVLLRAHGEPPQTYATARENNVEIIDATCPVVLALQRRIRRQYEESPDAQIVIFGKNGHAEVLGLVGQTDGKAIVIEHLSDIAINPPTSRLSSLDSRLSSLVSQLSTLDSQLSTLDSRLSTLDYNKDIYLYSQTTKSLDEYHQIIEYIQQNISKECTFKSYDTICRQVANRIDSLKEFASHHDLVLFVSGRKSSNGKVLFHECLSVNPNSHHIESPGEIDSQWLQGVSSIGICGATSTPKWLMDQCREEIELLNKQ